MVGSHRALHIDALADASRKQRSVRGGIKFQADVFGQSAVGGVQVCKIWHRPCSRVKMTKSS